MAKRRKRGAQTIDLIDGRFQNDSIAEHVQKLKENSTELSDSTEIQLNLFAIDPETKEDFLLQTFETSAINFDRTYINQKIRNYPRLVYIHEQLTGDGAKYPINIYSELKFETSSKKESKPKYPRKGSKNHIEYALFREQEKDLLDLSKLIEKTIKAQRKDTREAMKKLTKKNRKKLTESEIELYEKSARDFNSKVIKSQNRLKQNKIELNKLRSYVRDLYSGGETKLTVNLYYRPR